MAKIIALLLSRIGMKNVLSISITFKDGSRDFESEYPQLQFDTSLLESMAISPNVRTIMLHCSDGRLAVVEYE